MPQPTTPTPNSPPPNAASIPTWKCKRAWIVMLLFAILGLASDLASKSLAFAKIGESPVVLEREMVLRVTNPSMLIPAHAPVVVVPNVLNFTLVANPGAVFGVGAGKRLVFVSFTFVALTFGLVLFSKWTRAHDTLSHAGVGLLVAGGIGNLYDRIVYGCVRDFIHPLPGVKLPFGWQFPWSGGEVWPYVSNVADFWLIIAIGILLIRVMWPASETPKSASTPVKN